jgi:hypothetical protein
VNFMASLLFFFEAADLKSVERTCGESKMTAFLFVAPPISSSALMRLLTNSRLPS